MKILTGLKILQLILDSMHFNHDNTPIDVRSDNLAAYDATTVLDLSNHDLDFDVSTANTRETSGHPTIDLLIQENLDSMSVSKLFRDFDSLQI